MDMEVAGHWRREWAGTAEYGNETVGGVTRRVARAMEVLNASAPGARVRVMRAAYHSTAGPGIPASSYMMHSSRQVISSGNRFLESPSSLPMKPLEISSTPLESSHDSDAERENYKVTEPDDFDISEPSKWKGSTSKNSIRLPSEESSSTDSASIVDLASRLSSRSPLRRSFRGKEDNIFENHKTNSRVSPLLDAPVALSTLKYTSLLNGSEDWNNRRKSFSFEEPAPLHSSLSKGIHQGKEKVTMDSSTDSGICKSSEIVDDQKYVNNVERSSFDRDNNTFQDWLSKNRSYKVKPIPVKHINNESNSNNISLKSTGKVTITLPITIESDTDSESNSQEENERKIKRVEFCKTELHFAAETGTVNIIATDEKPPPSNDFRKKRSAFVPLNDRFEKPITLFGERSELNELNSEKINLNVHNDENTAATKSILKNKIPKPKPYLLGENMVLGDADDTNSSRESNNFSVPTTVSLINRQLQSGRRHTTSPNYLNNVERTVISHKVLTTTNKGLEHNNDSNHSVVRDHVIRKINKPVSPLQVRGKSRDLRDTDLAYFGIMYDKANNIQRQDNLQEEILHSVKLVQQAASSVSNSEIDSDEAPEYENLSPSPNFVIPKPKPRSKYKSEVKSFNESLTLKTIPERGNETTNESRKVEVPSSRRNNKTNDTSFRTRSSKTTSSSPIPRNLKKEDSSSYYTKEVHSSDNNAKSRSVTPLYMNLKDSRDCEEKKSDNIHKGIKSIKEYTLKKETKSPERKNTLNKKKYEILTDKPNRVEKIYTVKDNKEQIDRLATPKQRVKHEDNENTRTKKESIINKHFKNDTHEIICDSVGSISNRRKLIDDPKQHLNKSMKNNDKENKRDTIRKDSDIKIQGRPVQLEIPLLTKQNGVDLIDKKTSVDKPRRLKRSEYVINYDDKNGTVSSVRKINSGPNSHRRKRTSLDSKESPVEYARKDKVSNKIASLQLPDQQTIRNKLEYKNRKKKSKVNIQNSCQLL